MKQLYRMMRWTLVVLLALPGMRAQAQAPGWADAMHITTPGPTWGYSEVEAMTTDASGNIVLTGTYYGTVQFGHLVRTSTERSTVFAAKWNITTKQFDWVTEAPTNTWSHITGLVRNGNSYYLLGWANGYTFSSINFGGTELTLNPLGASFFVARLTDTSSAPQFDWGMLMPTMGVAVDYGICVSGGHTYLTGQLQEYGLQLDNITLQSAGRYGTHFVARLNDPGMVGGVAWAKIVGGGATSRNSEMGIVGNGPNLYLTGTFRGTASFGATTLRAGQADAIYVAKLIDDGTTGRVVWAKQFGCQPGGAQSFLAVRDSTVFLASKAGTDAIAFDNLILPAGDSNRTYVARLNDRGTCEWVQATSGPGSVDAISILVKGSQVYLAGIINYFAPGNVQFGATTLMYNSADSLRGGAFVARLTDNGNHATFDWAQMSSGTRYHIINSLALAGNELYALGYSNSLSGTTGSTQPVSNAPANRPFLVRIPNAGATTTLATRPSAAPPIYPNPAHGAATVQLPAHAMQGTPATLTLLDALGRPVRFETVALATYATTHPLDLTGLAPGLYLLRLAAGSTTATQRLVVE